MLEKEPIAVLTPFVKGKVNLPTRQDVKRISARTDKAYSTSIPEHKSKNKRPKIVEKQIQEMVRSICKMPYSTGQIRLRIKSTDKNPPWTTELFGNAFPLNQIYGTSLYK